MKDLKTIITEENQREVRESTNEIFHSLVENKIRGKISEEIFRSYFFPFFVGAVAANMRNNIIVDWVSIAGSPMSEVDVVDESGEVLFTVPPLYDTTVLDVGSTNRNSLNTVIKIAEQKRGHIPVTGDRYLTDELTVRANDIHIDVNSVNTNKQRWDVIFNRYNYVRSQTDVKQEQLNDVNDDLEY